MRAWSAATKMRLEPGNTCMFRLFGADSCFDGSLPDALLRGVWSSMGKDTSTWSRALCLVAPVEEFHVEHVLRGLGSMHALRLLGRRADHRALESRWPSVFASLDMQASPLGASLDIEGALDAEALSTRVGAVVVAAEAGHMSALRKALNDPFLAVRREAALGLHRLGVELRIAGWSEGPFLRRARTHPWGSALSRGEALPALAALLALTVDEGIQPRVLLCLAPDIRMHQMFGAVVRDVAARFPLDVRRHAAAALLLGGGVPEDPVLHRVLLANVPGDEVDLVAIAIQDPDAEIRGAAIDALRAGGAWPATALRRLAGMDPDPGIRAQVGPLVLDPLSTALAAHPHDKEARGAGLKALSLADPPLAAALAESLVQDADPALARVAAALVGAQTAPNLVHARVEYALPLLRYADYARRRIGVALLGALPLTGDLLEEVIDILTELAAFDPDPEVQQDARAALERWPCED